MNNTLTFDTVFGTFSEVQNGYPFSSAIQVAGRNLEEGLDAYQPLFSKAVSRFKDKKRSKYNGALVNNTFADATDANPAVMASLDNHPSFRYMVLSSIVSPKLKAMVTASLSGVLDDTLYKIYAVSSGRSGNNLQSSGSQGRVSLKFDTGSGICSEVDLGGNLETGYVVESIDDPLGLFPEDTVEGDFLESDVVQDVIRSQGERDRYDEDGVSTAPELDGEFVGSSIICSHGERGRGQVFSYASVDRAGNRLPEYRVGIWDSRGWLSWDEGVASFDDAMRVVAEKASPDGSWNIYDPDGELIKRCYKGEMVVSSRRIQSAASPGDHIYLRYTSPDGKSDKFISMDYSGGPNFTATWGRFGSAGRVTEYPVSEWDAYYKQKFRKGYEDYTGDDDDVSQIRNVPAKKAIPPLSPPVSVPDPVRRSHRPESNDGQLSLFDSYRRKRP